MPVIGIILVLFGILVIAVPQFLSLIVGFVFVIIGGNIILVNLAFRKGKNESIKFGSYEIFRRK